MDEGGSSNIIARLIEKNEPKLKVVLHGINGDDTYGGLLRLKYVLEEEADLNFIFFGANDASPYHLIRPAEFQDNLEQMISQLGVERTVLITPPFYNDDEPTHYSKLSEVELFRQATIDLAKEKSLKLIDIYQVMLEQENPKALLRVDGLHFTLEAYQLLVKKILAAIKNFIQ
ncbi:hypothetical protein ICE98_03179 [Lactococcus lactis]|nr:hypothetical protein [Lactococcus lactis]